MSENPKRVSENPRRHTTVCIISEQVGKSLLLFTGVSVNLRKIPWSARPKFQGFSYPTTPRVDTIAVVRWPNRPKNRPKHPE